MLKFCGFDFDLTVDRVLHRDCEQAAVFSAFDNDGDLWLIVESDSGATAASWICAPVSARVVDLVSAGRAAPADAVRHSSTGWVEVVRVVDGHAVPDQRIPCAEVSALSGWSAAAV
jgi:hypothetical protein